MQVLGKVIAACLLAVPLALPSAAQASTPQDQVRAALVAQGASATQIAGVLADPQLMAQVATSSSADVTSGVPVKVTTTTGGTVAQSVGSSCSGYSGWVQRTQFFNNVYGNHLARTTLKTNFCYNYRSVTYASSSKTYYIYTLGSVGGWRFVAWSEFSEGWYAYNGHTNGGVKTVAQADFEDCFIKYGCIGTDTSVMRTYAHYDGTWYTSGYSA